MKIHPDLSAALDRVAAFVDQGRGDIQVAAAGADDPRANSAAFVANGVIAHLCRTQNEGGFDGRTMAAGTAAALKAWTIDRAPEDAVEEELKALAWILTEMPVTRRP